MDKSLTRRRDVFVPLEHIGMVNGVKHIAVEVDKFGMALNVSVSQDTTSMGLFVYSVSMVRNGIPSVGPVIVLQDSFGTATIVRGLLLVRVDVSTTKQSINVCAHWSISGMASSVWLNLIVAVERYGMRLHLSAIVQQISTGMDKVVSFVWMGKFGTIKQINVFVERELNGMDTFVWWFRIVLVEQFGTKIHGHVSAPPLQFGMEDIVLLILVLVDNCGMPSKENASVPTT